MYVLAYMTYKILEHTFRTSSHNLSSCDIIYTWSADVAAGLEVCFLVLLFCPFMAQFLHTGCLMLLFSQEKQKKTDKKAQHEGQEEKSKEGQRGHKATHIMCACSQSLLLGTHA